MDDLLAVVILIYIMCCFSIIALILSNMIGIVAFPLAVVDVVTISALQFVALISIDILYIFVWM